MLSVAVKIAVRNRGRRRARFHVHGPSSMKASISYISRPGITSPVIPVVGGEHVDMAVHYQSGAGSGEVEIADDVGHVGLRGDDLGGDAE